MNKKTTQATTRLSVVLARGARNAVVFRRGPSKRVRMICWNRTNDTFTRGQWLAGRVDKFDLSPNGELLVYFGVKFSTEMGTFTAISRPPYFTALALWPDGSTWGGGGRFLTNQKVILGYNCRPRELNHEKNIPANFEVSDGYTEKKRGTTPPKSDWTQTQVGSDGEWKKEGPMRLVYTQPWIAQKPNPNDPRLILEKSWVGMFQRNGPSTVHRYRLVEHANIGTSTSIPNIQDLGQLDWADWDQDGSLLYSENGCLYRVSAPRLVKDALQESTLIADFCDDVFKNILPPSEARRWP